MDKSFDKIVATSEYDIERAAELRDFLKIDQNSYKLAIIYRDKFLMKKTLNNLINVPKFSKIKKWTDILKFIKKYDFPIIIKPRLEAGSEGIFLIKNDEDLKVF